MSQSFEQAKTLFLEGLGHLQARQFQDAETKFKASLQLLPDRISTLTNLSAALIKLRKIAEAESILQKIVQLDPQVAEAWLNLGIIEDEDRNHQKQALEFFERALSINPAYAEAWLHRGVVLESLRLLDEAARSYEKAIDLNPQLAETYARRAGLHFFYGDKTQAHADYAKAYALDPSMDVLLGKLLFAQQHICHWQDFDTLTAKLASELQRGRRCTSPFSLVAAVDSPALQQAAADIWIQEETFSWASQFERPDPPPHGRIRVGYYSADFHNHATSYLMGELFEKHDRTKFEWYAYSFGPDQQDAMRARVAASFDHFFDVRESSDARIVQLSRQHEIDIAVDLKGYTQDGRPGIFAARAAPVQVSYLGYPGTLGADFMDYLVADAVLIPEPSRRYYTEKVIYLPDSYQVNDRQRVIAETSITRRAAGLPESGFVFCCFNNNYKITPATFHGWMRLLLQTPGSVLWLLQDNPEAAANLRQEAARAGVAPQRLVFAERMPLPEHLARHRLADLFLDTLPYNAHTTASDALWAGLPVLTCAGESFASRVGASLLRAINLPELITTSMADYETLALQLATDPDRLGKLRQRLHEQRLQAPLFDSTRFARHLEQAYVDIHQRHRDGLPPDHIHVVP